MSEQEVYGFIKEAFAAISGRSVNEKTAIRASDLLGTNECEQVDIIARAEERFGLEFSSPELDSLTTVGDLVRIVMARA